MPDPNTPQHVAVPVPLWSAVIELLTQELPMKRVESLVVALRQCQPIGTPMPATEDLEDR